MNDEEDVEYPPRVTEIPPIKCSVIGSAFPHLLLNSKFPEFFPQRLNRILSKNRGKFPKFVLSRKMPWIQTSEIFCPKILR
jgi:hypothetical protein